MDRTENRTENRIEDLSYAFALRIVRMYGHLRESGKPYGLCDQVLRSGTSIGANVAESKFAQSTADFVSKLSIALKEANETRYWLRLMHDTGYLDDTAAESIIADCNKIIHVLAAIVRRCRR